MRFLDVTKWDAELTGTKGTRAKRVVFDPDTGERYFLKFPMVRDGRDYSTETWSEIIAHEVGTRLGFNVLEYGFAVCGDNAGCISRSMTSDTERLVEGDAILFTNDSSYDPCDKSSYSRYTFSFVMNALHESGFDAFRRDFVEMLVFDAIIGNSDRHQGNWGFIGDTRDSGRTYRMAPIYDSGCCLGREFGERQIAERLRDRQRLVSYVSKGLAELRPDDSGGRKRSHFALLRHIAGKGISRGFVLEAVSRAAVMYDQEETRAVINGIDITLPSGVRSAYAMSEERKSFMAEVIDMRMRTLKELLK